MKMGGSASISAANSTYIACRCSALTWLARCRFCEANSAAMVCTSAQDLCGEEALRELLQMWLNSAVATGRSNMLSYLYKKKNMLSYLKAKEGNSKHWCRPQQAEGAPVNQ
jgi:hypothetical protein